MKAADALLLDFGGTLDADGLHWSPRFHAVYRALGGRLDFAAFDRIYKDSDAALARLPGIRGFGYRRMIDAQADLVIERLPVGDRVPAGELADRFYREARAVLERNRPVLERLASRHPLAVVSNFTGNLEPCLAELGLRGSFRVLSDSTIVGATKPDPRIFVETLAALEVSPDEAWMIGDNFDADIRPAAALGLRTCWLAPPDRIAPSGCRPSARIGSLPELEAVVA